MARLSTASAKSGHGLIRRAFPTRTPGRHFPVLLALPLGPPPEGRRRVRRRVWKWALGQAGRAARRHSPLHRRQRRGARDRTEEPRGARQLPVSPRQRRRASAPRRVDGLRLLARRAPPRTRHASWHRRVRREAQAGCAVPRLPLLRVRQSSSVVPGDVASERRLAACDLRLPNHAKNVASDALALAVYLPLARTAAVLERTGVDVGAIPLSAYRAHSFYVMRTDALDRFGTRLESSASPRRRSSR